MFSTRYGISVVSQLIELDRQILSIFDCIEVISHGWFRSDVFHQYARDADFRTFDRNHYFS
ncbi:hypothetical protein D3C84_973320 [compost metagenome]